MQYVASKYVRVSDISSYLICPRLAYFRRRQQEPPDSAGRLKIAVLREMSRAIPGALREGDLAGALGAAAEQACADAGLAYGQPVAAIKAEALGLLDAMVAGVQAEEHMRGREKLLALLTSCERAGTFYSERLRLSGSVDRIILVGGVRWPAIISAAKPPPIGVYASDRVRLAAYALLLEEKYGPIDRGLVEYAGGWCLRDVAVRHGDRMAALSARNRILEMGSALPGARQGSWCRSCAFAGSCRVKVGFLDGLFGPMPENSSALSHAHRDK